MLHRLGIGWPASAILSAAVAAGALVPHALAEGDAIRPAAAQPRAQGPAGPYAGHRAVRITVTTPRQLMTVLALTDDVLTCRGAGIGTFDVRFTPEQYQTFVETGIAHDVFIEDLQAHLDQWWAMNEEVRQQDSGWYEAFRDRTEIEAHVEGLVAAHPDLATLTTIGESLEGRPIRMLRITGAGSSPPVQDRPALVLNGTQHSRESLSPMVTVYFAEHLLTNYATDPRIQSLVDGLDFHIAYIMNPDGYEHCWSGEWMWRKNRRVNPGSGCMGVDLNRNWGFGFGLPGSSNSPCNQTFRGASPFSEPETQALRTVIDDLGAQERLAVHVDIHSHGAMFLSPWGYTEEPSDVMHRLNYIGKQVRDAIAAHRGTQYVYGSCSLVLYTASGIAPDYAHGVYNALGWTIELPGEGYAFYPPPTHIIPVSEETALGLLELADYFLPAAARGGCCIPTGPGCIIAGEDQCETEGGSWLGAGTTCPPHGWGDAGVCTVPLLMQGATNAGLSNSDAGMFLDLTAAQRAIEVSHLYFTVFSNPGTPVTLELWRYPGSYVGRDSSAAGWVLHETISAVSNGDIIPTRFDLSTPLPIAAGETVGVYLLMAGGGVRYTREGAQPTWSDGNLTLFSERARSGRWGGTLWSPRTFAGSVHYSFAGCYADCDGSGLVNIDDFMCFINEFSQAQSLPPEEQVIHYANCDGSTALPILTIDDFMCFINAFSVGCP